MEQRGLPLTGTLIETLVWTVADRSGKHGRFGHKGSNEHRWSGFRRHPNLTLCKADKLERSSAEYLKTEW